MRRSDEQYRLLFEGNPLPMWVFDRDSLRFLAVNEAAIRQYGYSEREFLAMNITQIRPAEEISALLQDLSESREGPQKRSLWKHRRKSGETIAVEIASHSVRFDGIEATIVCATDVTERESALKKLHNSEHRYHALFEESSDAHFLLCGDELLEWNSAALRMFGYGARERPLLPARMSPPLQADGAPSWGAAEQKVSAAIAQGKMRFEWLHQRRDGTVFPTEVCLTAMRLSDQSLLLATVRDITERRQAEESLLFKTALLEGQTETTLDGILAVDENDHIVLANRQFGMQFGVPAEVLEKRDDRILREYVMRHVQDPAGFLERIAALNSRRDINSRDELRLKNGTVFDRYSAPLVDSNGRHRGRIWYHRDITDSKAAESRIQYLAYYDALTGLPNRTLVQDRLENALADARRRNEQVALLFLDLDRFKIYNDSLGHSFGDRLLKEAAERLRTTSREQDTVARIGGDEFLIVLTGLKEIAEAAVAAERIMSAMSAGFTIQERAVSISCSLGISIFPEHGVNSETLIKNADAAMYCVKESGRNNFRFFSDEMHADAVERLTMENNLRRAIERSEFSLVYQPQQEIESGRITGFEALIRWRHPELGLVPPDKFIPIAESSGLILPIGECVLKTACAEARLWLDEGLVSGPVAVNVSAAQFRPKGFLDCVRSVLAETGLPARLLELELTESLLLSNADASLSMLNALSQMGVRLAIDDFGTGFSSLSYLKYFPVNKLKIDRSLIQDLGLDPGDAAITTAIIRMAKSLQLKVIAEGVETGEQMSFLRRNGCDEVQGYYFSRPLEPEAARELLRRGRASEMAETDCVRSR